MLLLSKLNYIRSPTQSNDKEIEEGSGIETGIQRLPIREQYALHMPFGKPFSDYINKKATKRKAQWPFLRLPL